MNATITFEGHAAVHARRGLLARPDPRRRWIALALLCTASFMVILDAQIVILALPSIERGLGLGAGGAQWVLTAYLLSFGGLLLLGGRVADLLGRRRVFMVGTGLFLISSLACGPAWSAVILVAARVVQGVSAACMAPAALSLLMTTFAEGRERNKALGIWSAMGGLGATAALLIGGTLTQALGWQSIFLLNVPIAVGLLVLSPMLLDESRDAGRPTTFDPLGAITITAALVLLVDAIVEAPAVGWTSYQTIGLLAGTAALLALFARIESRSAAPLVPLRMFRSRTLVGGNLAMLLFGMCAWGMGLVVAQYAQQVLGYSPLKFGVGTITMTVMAVLGAYVAQFLVGLFMRLVGTPADQVEAMRGTPMWPMFEAIAPTLAYDHTAILGNESSVPLERAARLTVPALVMNGSASYPFMHTTAEALSRVIPGAQLLVLERQTHNVDPAALATVLAEKFSGKR